ncbi:hypothetical protein NLI96_g1210 [Meripilus lineatus]|uniref:Protein kinase domain-containing protein n=1 Tax=Meripilus lineatus TaxID=2056292 RepID=A0AAD5YHQ9_9APHY|nr:hypothetical protein NLI96_g1210 [Physisporinus lineatus]
MSRFKRVLSSVEVLEKLSYLDFTKSISRMEKDPFDQGAHANIFLAQLGGVRVCVRVLRLVGTMVDERDKERLHQSALTELAIWSSLCHKNVLPFYGYSTSPGPSLAFICLHVPAGNAHKYMLSNPSVDRLAFVAELGEGLVYLHSRGIVHGDLKGANILVWVLESSAFPTPLLCDFGSAKVLDIPGSSCISGGTTNWMAKELLGDSDDAYISPGSDIWAWGMTVYELVTDKVPYSDMQIKPLVLLRKIIDGTLPSPPDALAAHRGLNSEMWALLQSCWASEVPSRPSAEFVVSETWRIHAQWLEEKNGSMS